MDPIVAPLKTDSEKDKVKKIEISYRPALISVQLRYPHYKNIQTIGSDPAFNHLKTYKTISIHSSLHMGTKVGWFTLMLAVILRLMACHPACDVSHSVLTGGVDSVQPNKDSVRVGDTLYYNAKVPYKLTSRRGSDMVDFSGASHVITEVDINYVLDLQKGVPNFSYFPLVGSYSIPADSSKIEIKYAANDSSYDFKMGIICKKTGSYFLNGVYIASAERKCATANIDIIMTVEDPHFHYFYDVHPNQPLTTIEETHLYAFKVN